MSGATVQRRRGGRVSLLQICVGLKLQRGRSSRRLNEREIRHLKSQRRLAPSSRKAIRQRGTNGRRADARLKAATPGLF